ncbi:ABC transporter permease [Duganella rhizosphaerae]|uniref:ABC transporter permease n=1 Tax=Duganella rhizosphaerae TaxID=2885763 RepID=UPI0030E8F121
MNFRDFRIGLRLLVKEPAYSSVVVLGLSVGFAVCFLLLGFVRYACSYDAFVPDASRIYLIKHKLNIIGKPAWYESTPLPFLAVAQRSGMVESGSALMALDVSAKVGAVVQPLSLSAVHASFPQMFNLHPIAGDLAQALSRPDTIALTRSTANRLFGDGAGVGRTLQIAGKSYTLGALLADVPSNSTVTYDGLVGIDSAAWADEERKFLFQSWGNIGAKMYVKLKPGVAPEVLAGVLQEAADHSPLIKELGPEVIAELGSKKVMDLRLGALSDMYFDNDTANSPMSSQHGDLRVVIALAGVAVLILLLAVINYVNLATVRTLRRQREIAVRKVLGAGVGRLTGQFLAESLLVSMLATLLGLALAALLLPLFSELMDRHLDHMFTAGAVLLALALGAAVGALAGSYPAWVAWRVRPPRTLAGRGGSETGAGLWLRRALTVLQFSTAIGLSGVTLTIAYQTRYAMAADPGFDTHPLLVVGLPADLQNPASRGLREALSHLPGVDGVAVSADPVGRGFIGANVGLARSDGIKASVVTRPVSPNFFSVYGVAARAGRLFDNQRDQEDRRDAVVLNGAAVRALRFATPEAAVGQVITMGDGPEAVAARVIGVAPDIRHEGLHDVPQPIVYFPALTINTLTARSHGDLTALESAVGDLQRQYFPNDVLEVRRAGSYFALNYAEDLRLAKLLGLASAIAIGIAAFGIYVLAAYSVQRREREIVLRKLYGADARAIGLLIGKEFSVLVGVGAAIGLPLAWFATEHYLSSFVERAPLAGLALALALALVAVVAFCATLRHTLKATGIAPALAFRTA